MYYKKTDKGQAEIESAARQLPQRLRMVLVLVDGKRSEADLQQMLAAATPQVLQSLLDDGYIAPAPATAPTPVPARRTAVARPPTAAPPAAPIDSSFKSSGMPSRFDIASRPEHEEATDKQRDQIERSLRRALGPTADSMIVTVRQARTVRELVDVLKTAQRVIANARGKDIADEFASRYGSLDDQ
jgi:hypothetical protein